MATDLREQLQAALGAECTVERELGGGGMSRVFLARETTLGRQIVVKVLPPELAGEVNVERFRREIQLAAQLQHPHIVSVLNTGAAGDLLYYTMPFVEGSSLRDRLSRERQLPVETAVHIAREVADALEYAHQRGVVHRDIKPENILISGEHAMVVDFGIARAVSSATGAQALTGTGIMLGTPAYMSPEQATGERDIDGRSDIYSLGCVLYEMLAGEAPFSGPTAQAVISKRFSARAPSLQATRDSAPAWLDAAVAKALGPIPADRFQTAREFADALGGGGVPIAKRDRRPFIYAAAAALALLGGYAVFTNRSSQPNAARGLPADSVAVKSIAVLPFVNIGGDTAAEYFADGMTEELIGALAKIGGMRVAARSSVFALKGRQLDVRTVGDTLGVGTVLEGTVRRAGNRLRVTAQLVNTTDGYHLWSDEYDRELSDVFQVQDEIARAIAGAMRVRLAGDAGARMLTPPTVDREAHELYLKGRFILNTRGSASGLRALEFFQQAARRDSTYALAYVGLADAHTRLGMFGLARTQDALPKARAFAMKALALDSTLAVAHAALAHILFVFDWDRDAAEREFQRAIALDAHDANTRWLHGISLMDRARFDEAEAEFHLARELDPLLPQTSSLLGRFYVVTRQPDRAIEYLREALELGPTLDLAHQQLGHAYLLEGMHEEAIASFRRAAALSGMRDSAHLAYGYAVAGQRSEGEKVLRAIVAGPKQRYVLPVDMAVAHAGLGNVDSAFRWLERGYTERAPFMDGLKVLPGLESLRADPRFASLLRRTGIEP